MTSLSKDLPSALGFSWEAKCEEIAVLLHSQFCCRAGIAPHHPPARHFCSSWALLSSPRCPEPPRDMMLILQTTQKIQKGINCLKGPEWERIKSFLPAILIDLWQLCYKALGDLCNDTNSMVKPLSKNQTKPRDSATELAHKFRLCEEEERDVFPGKFQVYWVLVLIIEKILRKEAEKQHIYDTSESTLTRRLCKYALWSHDLEKLSY